MGETTEIEDMLHELQLCTRDLTALTSEMSRVMRVNLEFDATASIDTLNEKLYHVAQSCTSSVWSLRDGVHCLHDMINDVVSSASMCVSSCRMLLSVLENAHYNDDRDRDSLLKAKAAIATLHVRLEHVKHLVVSLGDRLDDEVHDIKAVANGVRSVMIDAAVNDPEIDDALWVLNRAITFDGNSDVLAVCDSLIAVIEDLDAVIMKFDKIISEVID